VIPEALQEHCTFLSKVKLNPEDEGTVFLKRVRKHSLSNTVISKL
jgi:hypothetical protein